MRENDLPALYQFQLDSEANAMAVSKPRDLEAFSLHWSKALGDPNVIARAIIANGSLVGYISCFPSEGQDVVGYWIDREHWGKGIATKALSLLLEQVSIRPLHARTARINIASIRVLERCGFVMTGQRMAPADDRFPACEQALFVLASREN